MKVKLLKKIRKRYSITHYPNGCSLFGEFEEGPITFLEDSQNEWRFKYTRQSKEEAYIYLYEILLEWIEKDYGTFRNKRRTITTETLWYKK